MTRILALEIITCFRKPKDGAEITEAWQAAICNGTVWRLPHMYGRAAHVLIERGICTFNQG